MIPHPNAGYKFCLHRINTILKNRNVPWRSLSLAPRAGQHAHTRTLDRSSAGGRGVLQQWATLRGDELSWWTARCGEEGEGEGEEYRYDDNNAPPPPPLELRRSFEMARPVPSPKLVSKCNLVSILNCANFCTGPFG